MPKVRNFRDQTQKQKKLFLKTCHLFKKIFWRQKLQFWKPSHKNARQKWKKIDTKSPKTYQKKCLLIQLSSRQKACNFESRVKK